MSQVLYINETRRDEIIAEAALKQTPVVITRRSRAGWRTAKARFQGLHRYRDAARLRRSRAGRRTGAAAPRLSTGLPAWGPPAEGSRCARWDTDG